MTTIVSSSLNPNSNSRLLAQEARRVLEAEGERVTWLDLQEHPLPFSDGGASYGHPNVAVVARMLREADAIVVATPIYNYDANAAVKNLVELTGDAWEDKTVGFLGAAGGTASYMSIMSLANSLMLDFRSLIVPRFVYATSKAFADGRIVDPDVVRRVGDLARATARLGAMQKAAA